MRHIYTVLAAVGGLSLTLGGTTALAGHCGPQYQPCPVRIAPPPPPPPMANCHIIPPAPVAAPSAANPCHTPVVVHAGQPTKIDPVVIHSNAPLNYLRNVQLSGSPHVNITRIHGQTAVPGLTDVPTGFTEGCHPESTEYCRRPAAAVSAPIVTKPAPVHIAAPAPAYVAPPVMAPRPAPRPVMMAPRPAPRPVMMAQRPVPRPIMMAPRPAPRPIVMAPPVPRTVTISAPAPRPVYAQQQWQSVSGPTMVGGLQASQVVCRSAAPASAPHTCSGPAHAGHAMPSYQAPMYQPTAQQSGWTMGSGYGYNH